MNPNFLTFPERQHEGGRIPIATDDFPSELVLLAPGRYANLDRAATYFGFSVNPFVIDRTMAGMGVLARFPAETCFALKGPVTIHGAQGFVVAREDFVGFDQMVGPIEREGRLKYIDGCTDSLLIAPPRFGDPCLNLLYFPPSISQTPHTHPSNRIGMIASGRGRCVTPAGEIALEPGVVFLIPKDSEHSFFTDGSEMRVIAWHPDSDFGPRDADHPMINRTMVGGESAANLPAIQTDQNAVYGRRECTFTYCPTPTICRANDKCQHERPK